jgi:hypothetical protein
LGQLLWQKTYGVGDQDYATTIHQLPDGGYILAGMTQRVGTFHEDAWVLRLDAEGNVIWQKAFGGDDDESISSIQPTADGGYIASGTTWSYANFTEYHAGWILKLDSAGNVVWQRTYGVEDWSWMVSVRKSSDAGYIGAAQLFNLGASQSRTLLIRMDSNGDIDPSCTVLHSTFIESRDTAATAGALVADSLPTPGYVISTQAEVVDSLAAVTILCPGMVICPTIVLCPPQVTSGTVGETFSAQFSADIGTAPYSYAVTAGALPPGLSLSAGGMLAGVPIRPGSCPFTITATDAEGCSGSSSYNLSIGCQEISVIAPGMPIGTAGVPYPASTFSQSGGLGDITWSATGALPDGMAFSVGILSGTPLKAGNFSFTVTATDANGCAGSVNVTLSVSNPPHISAIKKSSPPFKLVVTGSNLQNGVKVHVDGSMWASVVWKSPGKLQLTGSIKAAVPKGTSHTFRFVNPDGGEATLTWGW